MLSSHVLEAIEIMYFQNMYVFFIVPNLSITLLFYSVSGDTVNHAQSQLFAWEAGAKGLDVHALAEPTKLEALKREYVTKKTELKDEAKSKIFDKYGGESHLKAPPRELIFSQTEDYVEYSRTGKWQKMIFKKLCQIALVGLGWKKIIKSSNRCPQ